MADAKRNFIQNRVNLPTSKTSSEISRDIPPEIRARAFFSARVAEAHILERFRKISDAYSSGRISRDEARHLLRQYAVANGKDDGTQALKNLASTARLNLILDQNAKMARAVGQYEAMHRPANLKMFPYVIYRASVGSKDPRGDHQKYDGMVIDKRDPWLKTHWPPWEFGCNCDLSNCTAKKAENLGVKPMTPADKVKIDSRSGFAFDPSRAFADVDASIIRDPEFRAKVIDDMARRFPEVTKNIYRSNADGYLEGKATELRRRIKTELGQKVFPDQPKTFLTGEALEHAEKQARQAVPAEIMRRTDDRIAQIGLETIAPFKHYSSRPEDSENVAIRNSGSIKAVIDWSKTNVSPKRKKAVEELQNLLDKMPKFHGTLYRGCSFSSRQAMNNYVEKLLNEPTKLTGFISTTPDPVVAYHYAKAGKHRVLVVIPNSKNGVYFGPHSTHPEDEEALISYKFYLRGLKTYETDDILYVMVDEVLRDDY